MKAKIIKLLVQAHIIIESDDEVLSETITKPINIYRGQEITNELITKIEELTLQEYQSGRLNSGR